MAGQSGRKTDVSQIKSGKRSFADYYYKGW